MWGATAKGGSRSCCNAYFNPRSPCGERLSDSSPKNSWSVFQSTLPVWGATTRYPIAWMSWEFQSTLPVWGATGWEACPATRCGSYFNPRSPCGERHKVVKMSTSGKGFQSTLPVWGATPMASPCSSRAANFNPRSPCGERPKYGLHSPADQNFNPRSPCGERRKRAEDNPPMPNFNPRSPCGERHNVQHLLDDDGLFQSTLPVWGATASSFDKNATAQQFQSTLPVWGATVPHVLIGALGGCISIHAPRVGSDATRRTPSASHFLFQSTLPVWGATL